MTRPHFIHFPIDGNSSYFQSRPVIKKLFWKFLYKTFCRHMFPFFLGKFLELKSLGHRIFIFWVSLNNNINCQTFVRIYASIYSHNNVWDFSLLSIDWVALMPKTCFLSFHSQGKGEEKWLAPFACIPFFPKALLLYFPSYLPACLLAHRIREGIL